MKIILEEMIKICKKEIPPEFSSQKFVRNVHTMICALFRGGGI